MTTDEKYQEAVSGIALARETVRQVTQAIRDGLDAGDDPVIILHNMAGSLSKEAPFQAGGHGAAVFVTACFLLAESGFFDAKASAPCCLHDCATCHDDACTIRAHQGSWAETLDIMADPEVMADLAESVDDLGDIEANFVDAENPCCVAHVDLECALDAPESCCDECPALGPLGPVAYCDDPDCLIAECDGDHDDLRCPTTGVVRGNVATVNGRWACCGGLYPTHIHADPFLGAMVAEEFESGERERNGGA